MLIYLYGPDSYRRGKRLADIRGKYAAKHSAFSVYEFEGDSEQGLQCLRDASAAQSLFASKKFIVLRHLFPLPSGEERQYKKFLEGLVDEPDIVLTIVSDEAPPKAFAFLLQKANPCEAFPILLGAAFERFIREEAGACGACLPAGTARLTPALLKSLADNFNGDTWGVVAELQKISLGGTPPAPFDGASNGVSDFFGALMALQGAAPSRALPLLERLLQGEDVAKLFNVLASRVAPREKIRFADYDIALKTGKTDYALALTDYVLDH